MLYRQTYLESRTVLGDSGERTTDVNVLDPITVLGVEFRCANGATSNIKNLMADCISAIEVIDGSDVLYSLDGHEALGLVCPQLNRMPDQLVDEFPGITQNLLVPLMFGRYVGDTELSFDPTRFKNPQVRIKWNLATNQAVGASGFATGGLRYTLLAHVMEGAPAPRGFLMHKQHYTYTTAAGVEYIDLPNDYPYRGLLFRGDLAAYALYSVVSSLKLNCDANKYVPFDMRMTDLMRANSMLYGPYSYHHALYVSDDTTVYFILKYDERVGFTMYTIDDTVIRYINDSKGEGKLYMDSAGSAETSDQVVKAAISGYSPFRTIYIPFGRQDDPADWFPAPQFRSVRLEATGAVAAGTGYVCLSQERAY